MKSSVFSREWKAEEESASGGEVELRGEYEQTGGGLLGVRSKELVQHRLRSGCRISEWMTLEAGIEKGMMMSE